MRPTEPSEPATPAEPAATVILLRDSTGGLEVLLLERPHHRGSFAGAWVFPGGRVDPEDAARSAPGDEQAAARRAAARETHEETGLTVTVDSLVTVARWTPSATQARRFQTWFYYAKAPIAPVLLNPDESIDHIWISPSDALDRHASGRFRLAPPTWVSLHALVGVDSVDRALAGARAAGPEYFASRFHADPLVVVWEGDVSFVAPELVDAEGPRHRLDMTGLPWRYHRSS